MWHETLRKQSSRELDELSKNVVLNAATYSVQRRVSLIISLLSKEHLKKWPMRRSLMESDWPLNQVFNADSTFKEQIESIIRSDRTKFRTYDDLRLIFDHITVCFPVR